MKLATALINAQTKKVEKRFEEIILEKIKGPTQKEEKNRKKMIERKRR